MNQANSWVLAACLITVLGACSGDDDDSDAGHADSAGAGANASAGHAGSAGNSGSGGARANSGSGGRGSAGSGGQGSSGSGGHGAAGSGGATANAGSDAGGAGGASVIDAGDTGGVASPMGLRVDGNRLLGPDGKPFHGRGANLHDTRSCNACTSQPPDVAGLNHWADELLDNWHTNFVRFDLEAYADDAGYRMQWKRLIDDAGYLADVKNTVGHMTGKDGVYVMVTVFTDPSIKDNNGDPDSEWPTDGTTPIYEALADAFADDPKVLFALTNEPHGPADRDADLAQRYVTAIDAIRAVEHERAADEHVIVVQAPESWSRYLDYFVQHPIDRSNIAYEVHVYNPKADFDRMLTQPSQTLPILVGEYGPAESMTDDDIRALWETCQMLEIPHIAWNFHQRCDPDMLDDTASDGCGLAASTNYNFPRTAWGNLFHDYVAMPW